MAKLGGLDRFIEMLLKDSRVDVDLLPLGGSGGGEGGGGEG